MKASGFSLWPLLLIAAPCAAQGAFVTLTGTVSDSATLDPLAEVAVYLEGGNIAGWSNAGGVFRLPDVARGEYVVALRKSGYLPRSFRFTIDRQTPRDVNLGDLFLQATYSRGAVVTGMLTDSLTGMPLTNVTVALNGTVAAQSRRGGSYQIDSVPVGTALLQVRRVGYRPVTFELALTEDTERLELDIALTPLPLAMAEVIVEGDRTIYAMGIMRDFYRRRRIGLGTHFTRWEIEAIQPRYLTDILRRTLGVRLSPAAFGHWRVSMRNCASPTVYVDGFPMYYEVAIDEVMPVENIQAVEVYTGWATIPAEFNRFDTCGVIAVWTR
jgi:hypothetical protein